MTRRAAIILALTAVLAAAQTPGEGRFQQIKERLELTPEQEEQVKPILTEEMQKLKAVRDQGPGGRMQKARELRAIQDESDKKLEKILSKTQMAEMKKIREEARQRFREKA